MWTPVEPGRVRIADRFWSPRRDDLIEVTLPRQWERLTAAGSVENLRIAAGESEGTHQGMLFSDSDVWKWLEAAAWMLPQSGAETGLAAKVGEVVRLAAAAQMPDGYLNSYHQCFAADLRWSSLLLNHELYCAGHFIEAACAHHAATSSPSALETACRLADHVVDHFGAGGSGVPGHEEIELALCRLAQVTGDHRYLEQAMLFVSRRGRETRYPRVWLRSLAATARIALRATRARRKSGTTKPVDSPALGFTWREPTAAGRALAQLRTGEYFQDAVPLEQLDGGVGHAVRATYLFAGATDCASASSDTARLDTLTRVWDRTVERRAYPTGAMGALPLVEGFGRDWELPARSYAETCSAVGGARFTWRLLAATADPTTTRFGDWLERTLHNGVLGGISLSGDRFFYQNPMESHGEHERATWFRVACCPPNVARTLAALGGMIWTEGRDGVQLHLLVGSTTTFHRDGIDIEATVDSGLPWTGSVAIRLATSAPAAHLELAVRIPAWADGAEVGRTGAEPQQARPGSYAALDGPWVDGDSVSLDLGLTPRWVQPPSQVRAGEGRAALMYGPLLYCAEGVDNPGVDVHRVGIDTSAAPSTARAVGLPPEVRAFDVTTSDGTTTPIRMVPYYTWANRGRTDMAVWLRAPA